jgi:hypothetical protein
VVFVVFVGCLHIVNDVVVARVQETKAQAIQEVQ